VIHAVVFDVGEVLVNETREYGTWADWLGVPRHTFSAVFGATIASGRDYRLQPLFAQVLGSMPTQQDLVCSGTRRQSLDHDVAVSRGIKRQRPPG
jgi:hypothetical protein